MFTDSEISLLRDLHGDPRWRSLLGKLKSDRSVRWTKDKSVEDWAYSSGRLDENDKILKALKGE